MAKAQPFNRPSQQDTPAGPAQPTDGPVLHEVTGAYLPAIYELPSGNVRTDN